jgi:endonuclease/exonuclease/phosphatase family metal-dependent hydrolase
VCSGAAVFCGTENLNAMKKYIYLLIFILSTFISWQSAAQELLRIEYPLRVVSYNIRFDNPNDGSNVWANRKDRVAGLLRFHKADIICIQEALFNQIGDLKAALPEFDYYGVGREDGKKGGEFCPVFFDRSRFKILESGTFWLSETPEKAGSTAWYATLPRITTWVKFRDLASGGDFFIFNTHLDHASQEARDNGSALIMEKINRMCEGFPVILAGDFNDKPGSKPYNNVIYNGGAIQMFDARAAANFPHYGSTFTFVGWDFIGVPGKIIDYIFVNQKVNVICHAIINDNWDGVYPSDHLPVLIEAKLD